MRILQRWWRDTAFLGTGALAGVTVALASSHPQGGSGQAVAAPARIASVQAAALPTLGPTEAPDEVPHLPRRAKPTAATKISSAWEQAAAAYQSSNDPAFARSLMQQLPPKGLRKLALTLASQPNSPRTRHALKELFKQWGQIDPLNALAQAQALASPLSEDVTYEAMLGFAEGSPAQAAAYFAAPPTADAHGALSGAACRGMALSSALMAWSEQDPAAAANYFVGPPVKNNNSYGLGTVAGNWAQQDPAAALDWASRFPNPAQRAEVLKGVVDGWAKTNPQAAANYVLGVADGSDRVSLADTLVHSWGSADPAAAARWVLGQTEGVQSATMETLMLRWSLNNPAEAVAWTTQLPAGSTRDAAYASLASSWPIFDPAATKNWLGGLPAGDTRDAAIASYASAGRNTPPPADLLSQVQTISDLTKRNDTMVSVLNRWLENNPQAAQQWIGQAGLSATVTGKLKGG